METIQGEIIENDKEIPKHAGGRPSIVTDIVIKKLEEVFAIGGTDAEACFFAGITQTTLYNYQIRQPEFVERKEALKQRPILKARTTVVASLDDPEIAFRYLTKKARDEFGADINIKVDTKPNEEREDNLRKLLEIVRNDKT